MHVLDLHLYKGLSCPKLTAQGMVSSHPSPPVTYNNCCVSFLPGIVFIEPITLQIIDETCTFRYSHTSGSVINFTVFTIC